MQPYEKNFLLIRKTVKVKIIVRGILKTSGLKGFVEISCSKNISYRKIKIPGANISEPN